MNPLPFSEFLDLLRARGLGVSLHEHIAVGKLLSRWESTSRDELRDAIAALIARNEIEIATIRRLFDEFYPLPVPLTEKKTPSRRGLKPLTVRTIRDARTWRLAAVAATALCTALLTILHYTDPELPRLPPPPQILPAAVIPPLPFEPTIQSVPESLVQTVPNPQAPALPVPPSHVNWRLLGPLGAAALMVSMIMLWGGRLRVRARQWTSEAWQTALAAMPGPYHGRIVLKDLVYRLPRQDLDDAATLLARSFSRAGRGRQLDVQQSLRETLRSGMRPHLIFRPRRVQETILVLQDVSQAMNVHARRVEGFVADLLRQGIAIERWFFDGDISVASYRPDGPPILLEALARQREDWPLMVLSTGTGATATLTKSDRAWLSACRSWTRRVWLTPILDPQLWPDALGAMPMTVLPMTRTGVLQAANILAQGEHAAAGALARAQATVPVVTVGHVQQLERLACLVPNPSLDYLELLRQKFAPEVPESAVLHVATDSAAYAGMPINMTDGEIRDRLRELRKETPDLEARVRRYILKVLADSEPHGSSAAHVRWEIATALQRLQIAEITGAETSGDLSALARLARGPLWHELRDSVQRLPLSGPLSGDIRKAAGLHHRTDEPPPFKMPERVELRPFRWAAPRWQDVAASLAAALIVGLLGSFNSAFRVQATHALDAYSLDYRPSETQPQTGDLRIAIRSEITGLPVRVQLYRDNAEFGAPVDVSPTEGVSVAIPAGGDAHIYQVRAPLAGGAFALSNTLLAPSVLVIIDAQPWARVTLRSQNPQIAAMSQTTPAAFRLPEGNYTLGLDNNGLTAPRTETIQVAASGTRLFRFDMPNFSPDKVIQDLGLIESNPTAAKKN